MIRRDPTQIPMTDNDVQDIRDMLAERKKAAEALQPKDESPAAVAVPPVPGYAAQEEAKKKKDAMSRNERLGIA